MIALIDGDIVLWRAAAVIGDDSVEYVYNLIDGIIADIAYACNTNTLEVILSDKTNYRYEIYPEYKAHRKAMPKPAHLGAARTYLIEHYNASYYENLEADDVLGFKQDKISDTTVICSIDKDLLQIPGLHYNFVKKEMSTVREPDGIKHFYKQMLIGDVADNLKGVEGIGKVRAGKLLDHLSSEKDMMDVVCSIYNDPDRFQTNADCFWIQHRKDEMWSDRVI